MSTLSNNNSKVSVPIYKPPVSIPQSCLPLHVELIIAPSCQPVRHQQSRVYRPSKSPSRARVQCSQPGCGKILANRTVLKRHMLSHSNIYPYACDFPGCMRRCRNKTHMQSHRMMHLDASLRPRYYCSMIGCSRFYHHPSSLRAHMRTHQDIWPYMCTYPGCGRRFRSKGHVNDHRLTHLEKKARPTVVCPEPGCGKLFYWAGSIKRHMYSHTGKYPYVCDYPNCTFKTAVERKLKLHTITHSNKKRFKNTPKNPSRMTDDLNIDLLPSDSESEISVGSTDMVLRPQSEKSNDE